MKATAFISHFDCSRHDTGWKHPDHQGRLPGLMRAVHADMLTLFDSLLEVEGRHASEYELLLIHTTEYLSRLRGWVDEAASREETIEPLEGVRVSSASWDAATAAVGCTLAAIAAVLAGDSRNAFCAVRPPGRYVRSDGPGGFGLLNTVAIPATHLLKERRLERVLVVEWGGPPNSPTTNLLAGGRGRTIGIHRGNPVSLHGETANPGARVLPPHAGGVAFLGALDELLSDVGPADFVLLSAGFDGLRGDPLGDLDLTPHDYYEATLRVRRHADEICDGRLVSILEGGYDAGPLGSATVQHLRALAGIRPVG